MNYRGKNPRIKSRIFILPPVILVSSAAYLIGVVDGKRVIRSKFTLGAAGV
jgi:hypothetical protein